MSRAAQKTTVLAALLLLSACVGVPAIPAKREKTPYRSVSIESEANWWKNTMPLGAGEPDVTGAAIRRVNNYFDTLLALRRKAEVDPAVWAIYDRVAANMDQVELKGLYQMIPADPDKHGVKLLQILGARKGDHYLMRLGDQQPASLSKQGDFVSGARFRPLKGADGKFLLGLSMFFDINFGKPTPDQVGAMLKKMVRWYEHAAAEADRSSPEDGGKKIGPVDLAIMRRFSGSFPDTYPWAMSLLHVDDLAWIEQRGGRRVTHLRLVLRPNLQQLELRYPKIHQYLSNSRTMRDTRFTLSDSKGRICAIVRYSTAKLEVRIQAALLDGALIPLKGPDTDVSLDIDKPGVTSLTGSIDLKLQYWGIKVLLEDMRLPIRWIRKKGLIIGEYRLSQLPKKVEVTGRLWGVVPVWLVDMLIPSNLEKITTNFLRALIKGGGGKGMLLTFAYQNRGKGRNLYRVRFDGELADNGFIQLQTRLVKMRLAPRRRARGEIGDLLSHIVASLRRDLEAYRKQLQADPASD